LLGGSTLLHLPIPIFCCLQVLLCWALKIGSQNWPMWLSGRGDGVEPDGPLQGLVEGYRQPLGVHVIGFQYPRTDRAHPEGTHINIDLYQFKLLNHQSMNRGMVFPQRYVGLIPIRIASSLLSLDNFISRCLSRR